MAITWVELCMVQVRATSFDHTAPTVNNNYAQAHSSPDGNPSRFALARFVLKYCSTIPVVEMCNSSFSARIYH